MAIKWTDATPTLSLPRLPQHPPAASALPREEDGAASGAASDPPAVDVWIAPAVDRQVMAHLLTLDVEQGGLLVGKAYSGPGSDQVAHVRITGSAPAEDAQGTAFSLRMGTAVWRAAQAMLAADEMIVGWYHSHPGLTAFFSDTDRQTQRAFFNHPYSVGWVIDPHNRDEALFLGGDCIPVERGPDRLQPPA
jgi:proteasome lid subunit RPN8/RPN11